MTTIYFIFAKKLATYPAIADTIFANKKSYNVNNIKVAPSGAIQPARTIMTIDINKK